MKNKKPVRIVISGGPGTGKTMLINYLEAQGYFCFHEIIREMTLEAKENYHPDQITTNPLAFVDDPQQFNQTILKGRIAQYHQAESIDQPWVFYDRGLPDVIAYMDYFNQKYDKSFLTPCQRFRYDTAVILPPWEAIYRQDETRLENFEEAQEIHQCLEKSYAHCGYLPLQIPIGTIEDRAAHLIERLSEIYGN